VVHKKQRRKPIKRKKVSKPTPDSIVKGITKAYS